MKKFILILGILVCGLIANSQGTLSIPTDFIKSNDPVSDSITEWIKRAWIIPSNSINGSDNMSYFTIRSGFDPDNADLNTIRAEGGDTEDWPLYFRCIDSTIFSEQVQSSIGNNLYDIQGRYTSELLTWGNFLEVDHEIYYNSYNGQYYFLAAKANGDLMTLDEVLIIRGAYSQITGFLTVPTLKGISKNNLYKRETNLSWTQNPFDL